MFRGGLIFEVDSLREWLLEYARACRIQGIEKKISKGGVMMGRDKYQLPPGMDEKNPFHAPKAPNNMMMIMMMIQ